MKKSALLFIMGIMVLSTGINAYAASRDTYSGPGALETKSSQENSQDTSYEMNENEKMVAGLKAAETASQIITVVGQTEGKSDIIVSYYKKDSNGSFKTIFSLNSMYGKNGSTKDKREGDGKTPAGIYSFQLAFGLKDSPGTVIPYHKLQSRDYWVDDASSKYYNKLVNLSDVTKDWSSAENMINSAPYYNYGLALDYNSACTPGLGSAIFLHCTNAAVKDNGSQGCIRLPEEYVCELLKSVDKDTRIIIVSAAADLLEY